MYFITVYLQIVANVFSFFFFECFWIRIYIYAFITSLNILKQIFDFHFKFHFAPWQNEKVIEIRSSNIIKNFIRFYLFPLLFYFPKRILIEILSLRPIKIAPFFLEILKCSKLSRLEIYYLKMKFLPISFDRSRRHVREERAREKFLPSTRGVSWIARHSTLRIILPLKMERVLRHLNYSNSKGRPTIHRSPLVSVRFRPLGTFVLRRPLFADRRKCLKISVCRGLETVSNNGNMPTLAGCRSSGDVRFYWPHRTPRPHRHNRPPLMVLDWNLADFWPPCNG